MRRRAAPPHGVPGRSCCACRRTALSQHEPWADRVRGRRHRDGNPGRRAQSRLNGACTLISATAIPAEAALHLEASARPRRAGRSTGWGVPSRRPPGGLPHGRLWAEHGEAGGGGVEGCPQRPRGRAGQVDGMALAGGSEPRGMPGEFGPWTTMLTADRRTDRAVTACDHVPTTARASYCGRLQDHLPERKIYDGRTGRTRHILRQRRQPVDRAGLHVRAATRLHRRQGDPLGV